MGFEKNGMVYISQSSVQGQIFHWHDELELLLVVEGSIDLKVGYEWFRLEQCKCQHKNVKKFRNENVVF